MKKPYTDEDLIRFIYDEMSKQEAEFLLEDMVKDEELWNRFESIQEAAEQVEGLSFEPSEYSLSRVKAFARQESVASQADTMGPGGLGMGIMQVGRFSVNLNAVMALALGVFITLGVVGSAYKLTRQPQDQPNSELVQQNDPLPSVPSQPVGDLKWDTSDLRYELENIEDSLDNMSSNNNNNGSVM